MTINNESSVDFSVSNNSVTHLGRNLYSTTPPALAELVANSYDAYATEVDIIINDEEKYIVVADNGKGMTIEDVKNKYSLIGQKKIIDRPFNDIEERKPMGKKGIGKLAAFSIGESYTIYTKTDQDKNWKTFTLKYDEMINTDSTTYSVNYSSIENLPDKISDLNNYDHGFIVIVNNLRRKAISRTYDNIKMQLSRRFYILSSNSNEFQLKMNGEVIDLSTNEYYNNIQYLLYFGYNEESINNIFNDENVKKEAYREDDEITSFINENNIRGWIGSVSKPSQLKREGDDFTNIVVYINGKIADEDILKTRGDSRIANQYIVGEIQANYFDKEDFDPITSSRQGLDDSEEEVDEFINKIKVLRNHVISGWDQIRNDTAVESLPERIKNDESYQEWLNELEEPQIKINNKLLSLLTPSLDENTQLDDPSIESMITSIAGVINNIEIEELNNLLQNDVEEDQLYSMLEKFMKNIAKVEDLNHSELINARLKAITQLENLMDSEETSEKALDEHLSENPWLINPYWNISKDKEYNTFKRERQKYFRAINQEGEWKKNFLDMYIVIAESEYPIIVEYKKNTPTGHGKVTYTDIYDQITKYREAITKNISGFEKVDLEKIKAIFILSEDSGVNPNNTIRLREKEVDMLESNNIHLVQYSQLLNNARRMYSEHLDVIRDMKIIPNFKKDEE